MAVQIGQRARRQFHCGASNVVVVVIHERVPAFLESVMTVRAVLLSPHRVCLWLLRILRVTLVYIRMYARGVWT